MFAVSLTFRCKNDSQFVCTVRIVKERCKDRTVAVVCFGICTSRCKETKTAQKHVLAYLRLHQGEKRLTQLSLINNLNLNLYLYQATRAHSS